MQQREEEERRRREEEERKRQEEERRRREEEARRQEAERKAREEEARKKQEVGLWRGRTHGGRTPLQLAAVSGAAVFAAGGGSRCRHGTPSLDCRSEVLKPCCCPSSREN